MNGVTYLIVEEQPQDIRSFSRDEIWHLYKEKQNKQTRKISQDEVNKIFENMPSPVGHARPTPTPAPTPTRQEAEPRFKTDADAAKKAGELGFSKIKERVHGQAVFIKGDQYITRDINRHNGGLG